MPAPTPGLDRARAFLSETIEDHVARRAPDLPRIADMARRAGVATYTMWKAVQERVGAGRLLTRYRGGTSIAGLADEATGAGKNLASVSKQTLYAKTADRLEAGLAGAAHTPLPSAEELAWRYGVCAHTMRRALSTLVERGVLSRVRRRYEPRRSAARRPAGRRVILIAAGDSNGNLQPIATNTFDNYRHLDSECAARGLGLELHTAVPFGGGYATARRFVRRLSESARQQDVLGCVLWAQLLEHEIDNLISRILAWGLPVGLYHDGLPQWRQTTHRANPKVKLVRRVDDLTAGGDVAEALLAAGHREVVFLSPFHDERWSRQRLAGLEAHFERAGLSGRVRACTTAYRASRHQTAQYEDRVHNAIRALFPAEKVRAETAVAERMLRLPFQQFRAIMPRSEHYEALRPLLDQALRTTGATAWVAVSDTVALSAVGALARAGKTPGRDVAVIGFDDSFEACLERISSYSFNPRAVCRTLLRFLESPLSVEFTRRATVSLKGVVSHRGTTAAGPV